MSKKKGVKTKAESQLYKKNIKSPGYTNTVNEEHFSNLQGSNEEYYQESPPASPDKPKGLLQARIKNFIKEHIFEEIVSAVLVIVVAISSWVINSIISIREKEAAFEVRIEVAQDKLEQIEGDFVTKEYLSQELEILKLKIENAQKDDLSLLEAKIVFIENEINFIIDSFN